MSTPDFPETRLAFRVWQYDRGTMIVRSLNDAGSRHGSWVDRAMAGGEGGWPQGQPLGATCALLARAKPARRRKPKPGADGQPEPEHGPLPGKDCSCGIYATTDLGVVNGYLDRHAPVLGVVELGGRVIPATQGYRAAAARLAVILLIDETLTEPWRLLRDLAAAYRVPAVVPHSTDPEDYRELAQMRSVAAEAEDWLRLEGGGSGAS